MLAYTESIAKIYPGAWLIIRGDLNSDSVSHVDYSFPHDSESLQVWIKTNIGTEYTLHFEGAELFCGHRSVRLLSSINKYIAKAWEIFPTNVFRAYMSFPYTNKATFKGMLKSRWDNFAYYRAQNRRDFLIDFFKKRFAAPITHLVTCQDSAHTFDEEHVCNLGDHLSVLIKVALDPDHIIETKYPCLGAVVLVNDDPQFVHITPAGSWICGTVGSGVCRHPLSRLIFWTLLTKSAPYQHLFMQHYRDILAVDLIRYQFGTNIDASLQEMVTNFNLNVNLSGLVIRKRRIHRVQSWNTLPVVESTEVELPFYYHLMILAFLMQKPGKHETAKITYRDETYSFSHTNLPKILGSCDLGHKFTDLLT